ncbi:uncharacterized protein EI90DRAFT_3155623 [Cantharellus anzutake]|uniref:uncharacterized protein n=1 Tax=Cantharellus anzutake TaxID=1750568 RepID=UPI001904A5EA|nr:uncharacterized protein EI90DRAFT_3155623 [Cantharellus anzutake]KAF8328923.1 hypothetical protein EI90DRAFT_3155623 [Cantharellus anzutake]
MPTLRSGRYTRAVSLDTLAPGTLGPVHIGGSSVEVTEPAFGNPGVDAEPATCADEYGVVQVQDHDGSSGDLTPPQQHPHGSREIQVPLPNWSALKRSNLEIGPSAGGPSSKGAPTTLAVHPNVLDEDALIVEFARHYAKKLTRNDFCALLLNQIVLQSVGIPGSKKLPPLSDLIAQHPELGDGLEEAWKAQSFKKIRNSVTEILLPTVQPAGPPDPEAILDSQSSEDATVKSWSSEYRGDAANILYQYMMRQNIADTYARLLPIVQSSGMGKSRMVDEFSKKHFVVPFNLRRGAEGYPAPDHDVLNWFTRINLKEHESDTRFSAFLTALFERVSNVIGPRNSIKSIIASSSKPSSAEKSAALMRYPKSLAGQFRLFMTVGQRFGQQAPLRVQFYEEVLVRAEEASICFVSPLGHSQSRQLYSSNRPMTPSKQKTPPGRFTTKTNGTDVELATVVRQVLEKIDPRFKLKAQHTPILTLAFDEAHTLAPSNTGKSDQFSPPPFLDPSSRIIQGELSSVKPFSALGFDRMAMKFREGMTLNDVTKLPYRLSLGRPLWLIRYQEGGERVKDTITVFAIQNFSAHLLWSAPNVDSKEPDEPSREAHACVKDGFESVVTVAASEPILTEAAAIILRTVRDKDRSCQMLRDILEWPGMSKGDRGELITCNIIIDTALFTHDIYRKSIKDSLPSRLLTGSCNDSFAETFKSSRIYITHFIKVYDFKVLSVQYLFKLAARGVGVVCADNQHGIDVVIPILYQDTILRRNNMSVPMIQSKNDDSYGTSPNQHLFDKMDPFKLGIFVKSTGPPPVV